MENNIDEAFESLRKLQVDLLKESLEYLGIDFGVTKNNIDYRNYLAENPIVFYTGSTIGGELPDDVGELFRTYGGKPGETGLSDGMLSLICKFETGHNFGYTIPERELNGYDLGDAKGHKTFGYGLLYHPTNKQYMDSIKSSWSQQELESLYKIHAVQTSNHIDKWASSRNIQLNQNQKDAIASACYNFGIGFLNKPIAKLIAQDPNNSQIPNMWAHLSDAQGSKYPGLIKRRQTEAAWYAGNIA